MTKLQNKGKKCILESFIPKKFILKHANLDGINKLNLCQFELDKI